MLEEIPRFLRWVWSVPVLRAYVKQIVTMHDAEEAALVRAVDDAIETLPRLAADLRALPSVTWPQEEDEIPSDDPWGSFDHQAKMAPSLNRAQRAHVSGELAKILHLRAARALADASNNGKLDEVSEVAGKASRAARAHSFRLRERALDRQASPRTALAVLVNVCRALNPPVKSVPDWTDFMKPTKRDFVDSLELEKDPKAFFEPAHTALQIFVEELHVLAASTLSRRVIVERFKERCTWYDKTRLREIAGRGSGREDRLTLELAKYLHDAGLFVLVRPRVSNLEPDVVGIQGLAVEAKAYADSGSARGDLVNGFYQLHAYMTSLETDALRVTEGFLVAFRLGGPIYETPPTVDTGRFLIHSLTIDLGDSDESGRRQPPTAKISEDEIFRTINSNEQPAGSARSRAASRRKPRRSRRRWPSLARRRVVM